MPARAALSWCYIEQQRSGGRDDGTELVERSFNESDRVLNRDTPILHVICALGAWPARFTFGSHYSTALRNAISVPLL